MNTITCRNCGLVYPNGQYSIKGATNVTLNNISSSCPRCGHRNEAAPDGVGGVFNFDAKGNATRVGIIRLLRSSNLSPDAIIQLKIVIAEAKDTNASLPELTQQVSAVSPEFAEKLNGFFQKNQYTMAAIALLIAILTYFKPDSPTINNNYYNSSLERPTQEIRKQHPAISASPVKRGTNLTPPLSKKAKARKKNRRK